MKRDPDYMPILIMLSGMFLLAVMFWISYVEVNQSSTTPAEIEKIERDVQGLTERLNRITREIEKTQPESEPYME